MKEQQSYVNCKCPVEWKAQVSAVYKYSFAQVQHLYGMDMHVSEQELNFLQKLESWFFGLWELLF